LVITGARGDTMLGVKIAVFRKYAVVSTCLIRDVV
jgi:hypothetical protein